MQTILLVEDNEMNRDLISRRLKRRGYEVITASDGAAGVETAARERPDLILMDIGLPVIDGYEATRLIKAEAATRQTPIIGLSAHAMSGDAERALEAGCDDYDTKPIDWPRLLAKVQKLLERAAETVEASPAPAVAAPSAGPVGHLLVVDDTPLHLEMLSGRLSSLGYSFTLARSTEEALEAVAGQTYDLALVDVGLQHGDRPLWEVLREHPRAASTGCVILSPIDSVAEAVSCLGRGADEVVVQPFRVEELSHRVSSTIARRSAEHRLAGLRESLEAERARTEYLVRSWLPDPMIEELRDSRRLPPRSYDDVAILSWDTPGFERLLKGADPFSALSTLQRLMVAFEGFAEPHRVTTVTLDHRRVVAAAGPFTGSEDPVLDLATCAAKTLRYAGDLGSGLGLRFGLHVGSVVVGVLGRHGCRLGVWGEAVERADQILRTAGAAHLHASSEAWAALGGRFQGAVAGTLPGEEGRPIYRLEI